MLTVHLTFSSTFVRLLPYLRSLHPSFLAHLLSAPYTAEREFKTAVRRHHPLLRFPCGRHSMPRREAPIHCKRPYKAHVVWPPPATFPLNLPDTCPLRYAHLFSLPPSPPLQLFAWPSFTPFQSLHTCRILRASYLP